MDAKGVQKEFADISSTINKLTAENKNLAAESKAVEKQIAAAEREMRKLENAGKANTQQYNDVWQVWKDAKIELNNLSKKIEDNKAAIDKQRAANSKLLQTAKLTDLTYSQLRQRAKQLEEQMKNTVKSLHPEEWNKLNKEHKETIRRMEELNGKSRTVGSTLKGMLTNKLSFATVIGNVYTKALQVVGNMVGKVKEFVAESVKMATSAEGIDIAFNRIANKDYLKSLRQSTRGLVNDMELMKAAVRAENFKIPLDQLGSLLAFAQQRAKDTGESVDYLVESIVNGIGRKSPLILDNLGISAAELNEEIKKTGDFATAAANIVEREMAKVGDSVDLAADAATRKKVAWENLQLELGKRFLGISNAWNKVSTSIAEGLTAIIGQNKSAIDAYDDQIKKVAELDIEIVPLIGRYEELKNKTELSANEQSELNRILNTIHKNIPGVVEEFDKYGNVLSINTQKVWDFITAEKEKLKYMNREALEQAEKDRKEKQQELEATERAIERGTYTKTLGTSIIGYSQQAEVEYSADEMDNLKKQKAYLEGKLLGIDAYIKEKSGAAIEEQVNLQKKIIEHRAKFNSMNQKELEKWINDEKNAKDEYLNIAKEVYSLKFANQGGDDTKKRKTEAERLAEKQASERKKIMENAQITIDIETRAYNDRLKKFGLYGVEMDKMTEAQLRDRLALDKEYHAELQKIALEAENTRFKQAQEAAGVSEKSEGEQKKVYERLEQQHQANIQKIKDDSVQKQKDTQKQTDAAILKSIQEAGKASVDAVDAAETAKTLQLKQSLSEKLITQNEYEKELKNIEATALAEKLTAQEAYVQKLKDITNPTDEQKKALEAAEAAVQATQAKIYDNKINEEKTYQDRRKAAIEHYGLETRTQQYDAEMAALRKQYDDGILTLEEYEKAKLLLKLDYAQQYVNQVGDFVQAGSDLVKSIEEAETANTQAQYAERHTALKEQLDNGIISQEEYNAEKEQLDYEQRVAELEVQKKYADANFAMQVAQIGVATATGIVNAWASAMTIPPPFGEIAAGALTAILLGTAAAQTASANAERKRVKALTIEAPSGSSGGSDKPKTGAVMLKDKPGGFADGGYTGDGDKYEIAGFLADGRPFHRGEYFIAQEEMAHPAVVPMVRAIESIRRRRTDKNPLPVGFADGGYTQPNGQGGNYVMIDEKLVVRFEKAVDKFEKTKLPVEINYWEWKEVEEKMDKTSDLTKK